MFVGVMCIYKECLMKSKLRFFGVILLLVLIVFVTSCNRQHYDDENDFRVALVDSDMAVVITS